MAATSRSTGSGDGQKGKGVLGGLQVVPPVRDLDQVTSRECPLIGAGDQGDLALAHLQTGRRRSIVLWQATASSYAHSYDPLPGLVDDDFNGTTVVGGVGISQQDTPKHR